VFPNHFSPPLEGGDYGEGVAAPSGMLLRRFRATIHTCSFIPTLTVPLKEEEKRSVKHLSPPP